MGSGQEKVNVKKQKRKKRWIYFSLAFLLFLVAAVFIYRNVLNNYAIRLIGQTFKETVYQRSDGLYIVEYDSLSLDIFRGEATLYDFSISIDSTLIGAKERETIFTAKIPNLRIKIENIFKLPFDKNLLIESLIIQSPVVYIANQQNSSRNLSEESGYLYEKLAEEIDAFDIGLFTIESGKFYFKRGFEKGPSSFRSGDVSIRVKNFGWRKPEGDLELHSDDLWLLMKNQEFMLRDSIHKIWVDTLLISTGDSRIDVKNFRLYANDSSGQKTIGNDTLLYNLYNLRLPSLSLIGVDFKRAYRDNYLNIDSIALIKPDFAMESPPRNQKQQKKPVSQNNLAKMAAEIFNVVHVNNMLLDSGSFDIVTEEEKSVVMHRGPVISAYFKGFTIDTLNYSQISNHINIDSGQVKVENYSVQLPDSIHVLQLKQFTYSLSGKSNIEADSIHVFAPNTGNLNLDQTDHFDLKIPHASLGNLDVDSWLDNNQLVVGDILLTNPSFVFHQNERKNGRDSTASKAGLQPLFLMDIGFANIDSGSVRFIKYGEPYVEVDGLGLSLRNIYNGNLQHNMQIDEQDFRLTASAAKVWPGNNFFIELNNLNLTNQDSSRLNIAQASLFKENVIDATFDRVELSVNSLSFSNPEFVLKNISSQSFAVNFDVEGLKNRDKNRQDNNDLQLLDLNLGSGTLQIRDKGQAIYSAEIDSLDVSQLILTSSPTIEGVELHSHNNILYQKQSPITFEKLYLSQNRDSLAVENLQIPQGLETVLPRIAVKGLVFNRVLAKEGIEAQQMVLYRPDINLKGSKNDSAKTVNFQQFAHKVDSLIGPVRLDSLFLEDAIVHNPDFKVDGIRLLFTDVDLNENNIQGKKVPFASGVSASISEFSFAKKGFALKAADIRANLQEDYVITGDLNLRIGKDSSVVLSMGKSQFSFLNVQEFLLEHKIDLDLVRFFNPDLNIDIKGEGKSSAKIEGNILDNLFGNRSVDLIRVGELDIQSANLTISPRNSPVITVDDANLSIENIVLTEQTNLQKDVKVFDDLHLDGKDLSFNTSDTLSEVSSGRIALSYSDSTIEVEDFSITPRYSKEQWSEIHPYQSDWISATVPEIKISALRFSEYVEEKKFIAGTVALQDAYLEIYKDRRLPKPAEVNKPLLQQSLTSAKMPLYIKQMLLSNSRVTYSEIAEKSGKLGEVEFTNMDAEVRNITNIPAKLNEDQELSLTARTMFMNEAALDVSMQFDLLSPDSVFEVNGSMGEADLQIFNKITESSLLLTIKSGRADSLNFSFVANEDVARGSMNFYYQNLKIGFMRADKETPGLGNTVIAFMANAFVVNSNNPGVFDKQRQGKIYFKRLPHKSIFNYWTRATLSGILSSIGIKNGEQVETVTLEDDDKE